MPAQYPGNATTKAARAASGGGFESAIEVVTGTPAISSVTDNGDGTLTIAGSGFGSKAQAAPVLSMVDDSAYENGTENTEIQALSDGASYDGGTIYSGSINTAITRTVTRGRNSFAFTGDGKTELSAPNASGAENNSPVSDISYMHMRIKGAHYYARGRRSDHSGVTRTFTTNGNSAPGERVTIGLSGGGTVAGNVLKVTSSQIWFSTDESVTASSIASQTITGDESGASVTTAATNNLGPGSHKWFRFATFEGGAKNGVGGWIALPLRQFAPTSNTGTTEDWRVSDLTPLSIPDRSFDDDFAQVEVIFDLRDPGTGFGKGICIINGVEYESDPIDLTYHYGRAPVMERLGLDVSGDTAFGSIYHSDHYYDNGYQRVVLSRHAAWQDAKADFELQHISAWGTSSITSSLNYGDIPQGSNVYAYVSGPEREVNSNGYNIGVAP